MSLLRSFAITETYDAFFEKVIDSFSTQTPVEFQVIEKFDPFSRFRNGQPEPQTMQFTPIMLSREATGMLAGALTESGSYVTIAASHQAITFQLIS